MASSEAVSVGIKREVVGVGIKREVLDRVLFNVSKWETRMNRSLTITIRGWHASCPSHWQ